MKVLPNSMLSLCLPVLIMPPSYLHLLLLQKQVGQFTTDSKDYITKVMSVVDDNGLMNETIDKNSLKIPLGDGNARFIDGKNQLAVRNENPDRNGRIQVVLNGNTSFLAPADRVQYKNEFDRLCYLVLKDRKRESFILCSRALA